MPYLLFLKKGHICNYRLLQIVGGALRVKTMVQGPLYPISLIIFILMDFPIYVGKISMELSIFYFNGSQVELTD